MRRAAAVLGVLAATAGTASPEPPAPPAAPAAAAPTVLDDFGGDSADRWKGHGLSVAEASVAEGETPSGGGILALGFETKDGRIEKPIAVRDWRAFDALSMHVAVEADREQPLRVVLLGGTPARVFVRRFAVAPGRWRAVVLPLRDFREDGGDLLGSFASIERVRLQWDDGGGTVRVDDLRLLPGSRGTASCRKTNEDRLRLAFPKGDGRVVEGEKFSLFTNVAGLEGENAKALLARLEEGTRVAVERFGLPGEVEERVPLHVFATRPEYVAFVARLADHFGASVGEPKSDGFTVFSTPASSWDAKQGVERPVFVHEAVHGLVCRAAAIGCNGNWVQEGIATAVQGRVHPKSVDVDFARAFARLDAGEKGPFRPWKEALAERRPPMRSYPQLATVFEFLADEHAARLPAVWSALGRAKRPFHEDGVAVVAEALGTTPDALEASWRAWGAKRYAK
jgi:hypothetical protein